MKITIKEISLALAVSFAVQCSPSADSLRSATNSVSALDSLTRPERKNTPPADASTKEKEAPKATPSKTAFALLKPIGDWSVDPQEAAELQSIFDSAANASASITPGPNAPAQRRAVDNELRTELYSFLGGHTNSAYGPSVRLYLAQGASMRSCYAEAMDLCAQAWSSLKGSPDPTAIQMAREAGGTLARLLAMTGNLEDLDSLEMEVRQLLNDGLNGNDWAWAIETRNSARRFPNSGYNCGLLCLDQLARITQPGQYNAQTISKTASTTNGFTAAELVNIGTAAGLRLRAAITIDVTNLPLPSIVHLRSQHFVVVRGLRGAFYDIFDPAIGAPRYMLAGELAAEATACVLVNDAAPIQSSVSLATMSSLAASAYRGRIPSNGDHNDNPCPPAQNDDSGCCGAPVYFVSDYINLWVKDVPLYYKPAYGPSVTLGINYTDNRAPSVVSTAYWHGSQLGNRAAGTVDGLWGCSGSPLRRWISRMASPT